MDSAIDRKATAARIISEATPAEEWLAVVDGDVSPALREHVTGWIEASGRGDIDHLLASTHPEAQISQPESVPGSRRYRGREGVLDTILDWPAHWDDFRVEPKRIWEARPGRLMLLSLHRGRGVGSGIQIAAYVWWLFDYREGMLSRWQMFFSEADAEAALDS